MGSILNISSALKDFYLVSIRDQMDAHYRFSIGAISTIWRLPGYVKYLLVDGATRIVKLHTTATQSDGNGNRAKRRMGWTAQYRGSECWVWIPPKKKRRCAAM